MLDSRPELQRLHSAYAQCAKDCGPRNAHACTIALVLARAMHGAMVRVCGLKRASPSRLLKIVP